MPELATYKALVLTAPHLTQGHIEGVQGLLSPIAGSAPVMLAPGHACEWHYSDPSPNSTEFLKAVRRQLAGAHVDANVVNNTTSRRRNLLIADMDSTIIEQECIDEIADFAGCGAEVAQITERAMRGELDFEEALTVRVGLLRGLPTTALDRVIDERLKVSEGARTLIATMSASGAYCALVSGGFTFFTSRIARLVGFHEHRANTLEIEDARLTGRAVAPILGQRAKLDALSELCTTHKIARDAALAVGDGANDLAMIKAAGLGVAYHAKPIVAAEADAQLDHSDLSALLYLQGYHEHELIC